MCFFHKIVSHGTGRLCLHFQNVEMLYCILVKLLIEIIQKSSLLICGKEHDLCREWAWEIARS